MMIAAPARSENSPRLNHPAERLLSLMKSRPWVLAWVVILLAPSPAVAAPSPKWDLVMKTDGEFYPSLIIATSAMEQDADPRLFGDAYGPLGVEIVAPHAFTGVRVVVEGSDFIRQSVLDVRLPKKGVRYRLYPVLRYDYRSLMRIRQPFPETVSVAVTIDGNEPVEQTRRISVRSINDCPFVSEDEDGRKVSLGFLFAAYVNENHPVVDKLLREALDSGGVSSFGGYQGSADDVLKEIGAVWKALKKRGFAYSSITRPSKNGKTITSQHVRLIGDSIRTSQANCVDGSVLFASVFRKLGMDPFLVSVPGHMFVGVYLDSQKKEYACIETTMLGNSTFAEAVRSGNKDFKKYRSKLNAAENKDPDYEIIDIAEAREMGILPLREPDAE